MAVEVILQVLRNYTLQMFLCMVLFCFHMQRRKHFKVKFISGVIILFIPAILCDTKILPMPIVGGTINLLFLIVIGLMALLIWLCFVSDWRQIVFICTSCWAVQHCMACAYRIVFEFLIGTAVPTAEDNAILCAIVLVINAAILIIFRLVFIEQILRNGGFNGFENSRNVELIILALVIVCVAYFLSLFTAAKGKTVYELTYAIICCILLLFIQYGNFVGGIKSKKNDMLQDILHSEHEQHKLSEENIMTLNQRYHDLKHQIINLREIIHNEEIDKKLSEIYDSVIIYDSFAKTGNNTLDVILTEKKLYCDKYDIAFDCMAEGEKLSFMGEEDIYSLFGNLLDNAVESVMKAPAEKRAISLQVLAKKQILVIHVENYCADTAAITFSDGLPQTTKGNFRFHGFGMLGIKYVTEKYGGTLSVVAKDESFVVNIIIPLATERKAVPSKPEKAEGNS